MVTVFQTWEFYFVWKRIESKYNPQIQMFDGF